MSGKETYDLAILGAGFFGSYAALHFAKKGLKVVLVDREPRPWSKASLVNQARVHSGYHYPRSIKTARLAQDHREQFIREHAYAINKTFTAYYAIERRNSLTNASQFERFCKKIDIPAVETKRLDLFNHDTFEAVYETEEYSFDPLLIRRKYFDEIAASSIKTLYGWFPIRAENEGKQWGLTLGSDDDNAVQNIRVKNVINATYANINAVNRLFGVEEIPVSHELSEMVLLQSGPLSDVGLTIMDGPFVSIMPYGRSGLTSLSSVRYTHTAYSAKSDPEFPCQRKRPDCTPELLRACNSCRVKPPSNARKMLKQLNTYLAPGLRVYKQGSLMTVKTKLRSAMRDDGRPTEVHTYLKQPFYGCVFSGKINSIYEVEEFAIND